LQKVPISKYRFQINNLLYFGSGMFSIGPCVTGLVSRLAACSSDRSLPSKHEALSITKKIFNGKEKRLGPQLVTIGGAVETVICL
jgi:hypothetical protein